MFDAGIVIIKSPEGLGCCGAVVAPAENLGNGLGQSESVELIQEPFKEAGAKTGGFENDIGGDFDLGQIPVMVQKL